MGSGVTKGKGAVTGGDVGVYEEKVGRVRLEVRLEGETVWLSLTQMAELFGRDNSLISRTCARSSGRENSTARQLLQKVQQLPPTVGPTRSSTSTWTPGQLEAWHPVPHLGDRQAA